MKIRVIVLGLCEKMNGSKQKNGSVDREDVPDRDREGGGGCTVVGIHQTFAFGLCCRNVFEDLHSDLSSKVRRWRAFLGDKTGFFAGW